MTIIFTSLMALSVVNCPWGPQQVCNLHWKQDKQLELGREVGSLGNDILGNFPVLSLNSFFLVPCGSLPE